MPRIKNGAVLIADLETEEQRVRAQKARTMLVASLFDPIRVVDVSRLHVGFAVLHNDDVIERCWALCSSDHPNIRLVHGEINWLNPAEIDGAATMPGIAERAGAVKRAAPVSSAALDPLRQKFQVLSGRQADLRWSRDRLQKEIDAVEDQTGVELSA